MTRYFIDQELTDIIELSKDMDSYHHIVNVLRYKLNQQIVFVNKSANVYELSQIENDRLIFSFIKEENINPELRINVDIFLPFLKKNNFELVLQKNTELGAKTFFSANMKNNVSKVDQKSFDKKLGRYKDIIKNASMQSQRNTIPDITGVFDIYNFDYSNYDLVICCYETRIEDNILSLSSSIKDSRNILIVTGPEGGFCVEEINHLRKNTNVKIVSLGNRILRAETASISCMTLVSSIIEND